MDKASTRASTRTATRLRTRLPAHGGLAPGPHGTAYRMDRIDQDRHIFRRGKLRNTMSQIEDMPRIGRTEAAQYSFRFACHRFRARPQNGGVQIALQGHTLTHTGSGLADINGPVQPQAIGTGVSQGLQPEATALGKDD